MLCFFAFIPASFLFHDITRIIDTSSGVGWEDALAFGLFGGLLFFLGLLAFRAFTGRGRKSGDGLLPPWAMVGAIHTFGVIGALIVIVGVVEREVLMVLGGVVYFVIAYEALVAVRARSKSVE